MIKAKSFAEQVSMSTDLLYLVRGYDEGEPAWHFVMLENKNKKILFLNDIKQSSICLKKYGKILASGWGINPPDDILRKIKESLSCS